MADPSDELHCDLCGYVEDRSDSAYCRKCGARLTSVPAEASRAARVAVNDVAETVDERSSAHEPAPSTQPDGPPEMEKEFGITTRGIGPLTARAKPKEPPADAPREEAHAQPEMGKLAATADDLHHHAHAAREADRTGPAKPSDRPPPSTQASPGKKAAAAPAHQAPARTIAAVARVLSIRFGYKPIVAALLTAARAIVALALAGLVAAAFGYGRDTWSRDVARAIGLAQDSPVFDVVFGVIFLLSGLLVTRVVFGLTSRGWKRPRWGRA